MLKRIAAILVLLTAVTGLAAGQQALTLTAAEPSETSDVSHWEGNLWRPEATDPLAFETIEFDLTRDDDDVPQSMVFAINATHGTSPASNELTCYSGGTAAISNEMIMTFIPFGNDIYYMQTTVLYPGDFWGGWNFDGYIGQDVLSNPTGPNEAEGTYVLHYNVPDGEGGTSQISCDYLWRAVCVSGCVPTDLTDSLYIPTVLR
ncbi:MAG: hypothetical protein KC449_12670 [Anaerolineales bacterium]|nr:hypothetical protein [Anaerolineales bacterium]